MNRRANLLLLVLVGLTVFAGPALGAKNDSPAPGMPTVVPTPAKAGEPALTPLDQVQIKVWIAEYNEQGLRELGTNLEYKRFVRGVEGSGTLEQLNTNTFDPLNPDFSVTLPTPDQSLFGPPLRPDLSSLPGIQTQAGGGLVASIIDPGYGTVDGLFRAIEQKSEVNLVSKPEILVVDNGIAEIHAGGEVPYQSIKYNNQGVANLNVTWEDIGVNMKIQPLILPSEPTNSVKLNIEQLSVSDVVRIDNIRGIDLPVFATREQTGTVIVPDANTIVIGGLSSRIVQKTERRVPILGKIPLLGIAFRGRNSRATNSHLLIFVQPTIVDLRELTPEADKALNFWTSPEWQNSDRIKKEVVVMQEEPFQ